MLLGSYICWGVGCKNKWKGPLGPIETPTCPKCGSTKFLWVDHIKMFPTGPINIHKEVE